MLHSWMFASGFTWRLSTSTLAAAGSVMYTFTIISYTYVRDYTHTVRPSRKSITWMQTQGPSAL